ncbi:MULTISPECIES: hypothetical protein [Robiginitalea]|uniref:Uncharacterized protein n=1 Tax=Robiginitalea biformata (strain ATCC BAA-864 / DSM 15991 / KCTC 12146 / HTCC2501) TaxID=313596 RepID=A4CIF2_ROBBH|nr:MULTISPECIES: hypothetical protein [Robiginitalea]EAR16710.1 hypothetical protein RB2501_07410 [Robiginitalea biformata HTCC2501]MDC6353081.1 hypothetical protein [Robiginitalea sp. PM2]MDC6373752.1 hypothetical protein [Robiginitalea sp. SP8]
MKRKLKEELLKLSTDIITSRGLKELPELYERARDLYEKLAVLKFIEEKLNDVQIDVSKSEVASKFESIASAVLNENKSVPESNPHEEDIIVPGIDTIKHMVSEMPGGEELEEVLERLIAKNDFVKNDKQDTAPDLPKPPKPGHSKSLNDTLTARKISVGLNDRLAFVKHLFNDDMDAFNRILSKLNDLDSVEHSVAYIRDEVKPGFNQWEGKDEYEARFMELIERRFN